MVQLDGHYLPDVPRSSPRVRRLTTIAMILGIVVVVGAPLAIGIIVGEVTPYAGAAIDNEDANILLPSERAALDAASLRIGMVFVIGAGLGVPALVLGILTAGASRWGRRAIGLACGAFVLCVFLSFWTVSAANTPDDEERVTNAASDYSLRALVSLRN